MLGNLVHREIKISFREDLVAAEMIMLKQTIQMYHRTKVVDEELECHL